MRREHLVVRRQQNRRTSSSIEREQLTRVRVLEYLGNVGVFAFSCPNTQRLRPPDLSRVPAVLFFATVKQICDRAHPIRGCDQRARREAELARQIAAGGPKRQNAGPGEKMVERLLFDRIDAIAARAAIAEELNLPRFRPAHEAQSALPVA